MYVAENDRVLQQQLQLLLLMPALMWTKKERACIHTDSPFGFDEGKRKIRDTAGKRLQVRYTLKNTASVYMITRQTRQTNQLFFNTTPAPGYGVRWGGVGWQPRISKMRG